MKIVFETEAEFKSVVWNTEGEVNLQQKFLEEMVRSFPIELTDVEIENGRIRSASLTVTPNLNRFKLNIGDWSDDGHGENEEIVIETNLGLAEIRQAYREASVALDFALHPRHDQELQKVGHYTGGKHTHAVDMSAWEHFNKVTGFFADSEDEEDYEIEPETYAKAFLVMVKHVRPDAVVRLADVEPLESVNGMWSDLNCGFGYEVFMDF